MHAVKEFSNTTVIQTVFDALAKSSSNVSQRDTMFVDPAIHSPSSSLTCCSALGSITLTADIYEQDIPSNRANRVRSRCTLVCVAK